jgi:hypothetical protein
MSLDPGDPPRQPGTPSEDDLPPTGDEAQSERRQTVAPLIWLALGLVAIALFVVALVLLHGVAPLPGPGK